MEPALGGGSGTAERHMTHGSRAATRDGGEHGPDYSREVCLWSLLEVALVPLAVRPGSVAPLECRSPAPNLYAFDSPTNVVRRTRHWPTYQNVARQSMAERSVGPERERAAEAGLDGEASSKVALSFKWKSPLVRFVFALRAGKLRRP